MSEEEEERDKYNKEDGDEGTMVSGEDIGGPNEDTDRDDSVSDGDKDDDQYAVRGGGGSESDKWESGGSDGDENKESLEAEETEEADKEEEIDEEA